MSNPEDNLAKALSENGAFDTERADELRKKAVGAFEAGMRKVERCLWIYLCSCAWLVVFTLFHFMQSSSTKALLFYGLLLLIFFQTTILVKLWYWVMNNKISVLKAVKQLALGGPVAKDAETPGQSRGFGGPLQGLSRGERAVWWGVLLAGSALIGAVKSAEIRGGVGAWNLDGGGTLTSEGHVTLAEDGSGSAVTHMSWVHDGALAKRGFHYYAPKESVLRFSDAHGRELPFTMSPQDGHICYDVALRHPVMPGRRFSYTMIEERSMAARKEGGVWTYWNDSSYGYDTNEFSRTVVLPRGAEIVSAEPWPVAAFTLDGHPTVRFEGTRGQNEPFRYTVKYRLPGKS